MIEIVHSQYFRVDLGKTATDMSSRGTHGLGETATTRNTTVLLVSQKNPHDGIERGTQRQGKKGNE